MRRLFLVLWFATCAPKLDASPKPPLNGDIYGWELPALVSIDTIDFPKRLIRNRSYGRVAAEVRLRRDGEPLEIEFTYVENGDLIRWAEKIISSARFTAARLDGSQVACRVPVQVVFVPKSDGQKEHIQIWYPTDSAAYQPALIRHFLLINESLAPVIIRVGSYDWVEEREEDGGLVTFEVYVQKDGSREEGRLISSPGDAFTRQALTSVLEMQILPPRFRKAGYGCWTRVLVGFCNDWEYPTQPVDRSEAPYRGWPAPITAPVGAATFIPPQFVSVELDSSLYNGALLDRTAELVLGLPIYYAQIDTAGHVLQWFRARNEEPDKLTSDWEYLSWSTPLLEREGTPLGAMSLTELARLSADELETILPALQFSPGRDAEGNRVTMWVALTPALFR